MSDFEKWFRSLNANGKTVYFLGNEHKVSEMAWNHQQAIIDDLIYKAKLRESDHQALLVKYQATKKCWEDMGKKCESLKAQLNNIETCYIEKKKECEGLQGQIDASKSSQPKLHKTKIGDCLHFSTTMFHDGKATCFDCDAVVNHKREVIGVMQTKALRGAND